MRDAESNSPPGEERLLKFGVWLRNTSLEGNAIIGLTDERLENSEYCGGFGTGHYYESELLMAA